MISPKKLFTELKKNDISFFSGVPDSILKKFINYLPKNNNHIIASNEGSAVGIAIGYNLSKKKIGCVYLQNSGLSNAINPLISIANPKVYSIPILLIIGWRGSPLVEDEPQHKIKGSITPDLLKLLKIKYVILKKNNDMKKIKKLVTFSKKNNKIVALLVEKGAFINDSIKKAKDIYSVNKETFLKKLLENINTKTKIICSTGFNSREIMFIRKKYGISKGKDFYMVGGMGHTSSVALGYSMFKKNQTICLDGDGSLLMHLGSLKTVSKFAKGNLKYILLNNGTHDSVGGHPTYANTINFSNLVKSLGIKKYHSIKSNKDIKKKLTIFLKEKKPSFLEVKIRNNNNKKLPRPENLIKIKNNFIN